MLEISPRHLGRPCAHTFITNWAQPINHPSLDIDMRVKNLKTILGPSLWSHPWSGHLYLKTQTSRGRDKTPYHTLPEFLSHRIQECNKTVFVLHYQVWAGLLTWIDCWSLLAIMLWLDLIWYITIWKEMRQMYKEN
jgi:hypothetical protein